MAYSKDEAITLIKSFLNIIGSEIPVERAYLFGSYATEQARDYSDIDLAIITPVLTKNNSFDINRKVFHRAMLFNVDIEPICFSTMEFELEQLPIIASIKQTGIEINRATGRQKEKARTNE